MRRPAVIALILGLFSLISIRMDAWSGPGHRVVGQLAIRELQRQADAGDQKAIKTRDAVTKILKDAGITIETAAVWADTVRKTPPYSYADNWHFVSIPRSGTTYDASTQCRISSSAPEGNCVIGGLGHFRKVLTNSSSSSKARLDALRFIVHFIGDMHQPLHTSEDGDTGGNFKSVCFQGTNLDACTELLANGERKNRNLHATWDKYMIAYTNPNELNYVDKLDNRIKAMSSSERAGYQNGTPIDWAQEAHALARMAVYEVAKLKDTTIPHAKKYDDFYYVSSNYRKENMKKVDEQLMKAGLRLAAYLKDLF